MSISIHAPREGSDRLSIVSSSEMDIFLSTLPARGATIFRNKNLTLKLISIHAPREGSDLRSSAEQGVQPISIHAPREGSDL